MITPSTTPVEDEHKKSLTFLQRDHHHHQASTFNSISKLDRRSVRLETGKKAETIFQIIAPFCFHCKFFANFVVYVVDL